MADDPPDSRHVLFAERFAAGPVNRLNAYAAIERARLLLRDTKQIAEIFERERKQEEPAAWVWHGLAVVPYTLVGLATCLEWHARSRITDLYSYKPDSIHTKTLEGKAPARVLSQMIKANVSIPQLLGASITVGSTKEYLSVFEKLFEILEIPLKPEKVIQPHIVEQPTLFGDPIREPLVRDKLEALFATRHALVHEIGGPEHTLSEVWGGRSIVRMCQTVISTISDLEGALTEHAPTDFPNLLTEQGYPVDPRSRLMISIRDLEQKIGASLEALSGADIGIWTAALHQAQQSSEAYDHFFLQTKAFQGRYKNDGESLSRANLEHRLTLLDQIASALTRNQLNT